MEAFILLSSEFKILCPLTASEFTPKCSEQNVACYPTRTRKFRRLYRFQKEIPKGLKFRGERCRNAASDREVNDDDVLHKYHCKVYVANSRLIGQPKWIPFKLHVSVFVLIESNGTILKLDLIPEDARNTEVIIRLLRLQRAPAEIRMQEIQSSKMNFQRFRLIGVCIKSDVQSKIRSFNLQYDTNMHLVSNNCYTYVSKLCEFLVDEKLSRDAKR
mmetsp:Transcript_4103/g.7206  ORF Transcript_4103/g.7206 Transcript_4103/m.7206 type:complete len:216 (+) Transcript_4103:1386-2033(+)